MDNTNKTKLRINEEDLARLEAALLLNAPSNFERGFLANLKGRFEEYGYKMVITEEQQGILITLSHRYWAATGKLPLNTLYKEAE